MGEAKKKKEVQPLDWNWTIIPTQKFFPRIFPSPQEKNQGFQMTPQDKPLFFLEDSIWKSRLRDLGCETVQALDTERRGFPTSSQWTDIYHLSSLPCSVHLLERVPSFILKLAFVWYEKTSNKAVPGISSPMRSGSQALPYRYGKRALCEAMAQPQH